MARQHTMTPARRRALRKAQAVSARKRRGKGKGKLAAANRQLDSRRRRRGGVGRAAKYVAAAGVVAGAAYVGKKHYQIDFATINARASQGGKSSQGIYGQGGRKHAWAARRIGGRYTGGILSFGKQRPVRHRF